MTTVVLRIKKKYLEQIRDGQKTIEYRDFKPFYKKMFQGRTIDQIRFHYQSNVSLVCTVEQIKVVRTPKTCRDSNIPFSSRVFAIHVRPVLTGDL